MRTTNILRFFPRLLPVAALLFLWTASVSAQNILPWSSLADVRFADSPLYKKGGTPTFGEKVKSLEGQTVILQGYMLPLTVDNKLFILSRYSYTECYFCGMAGKETVVELKMLDQKWKFDLDEPVKVQGKLRLSYAPDGMAYILEEVRPL